jgi:hypothetical protein
MPTISVHTPSTALDLGTGSNPCAVVASGQRIDKAHPTALHRRSSARAVAPPQSHDLAGQHTYQANVQRQQQASIFPPVPRKTDPPLLFCWTLLASLAAELRFRRFGLAKEDEVSQVCAFVL